MFNYDQKIYTHLCVPITQYEICYIPFIAGSKSVGFNLTFVDVFKLLKLPRAPPICLLKILLSIPIVRLVN
jgi:hypothetical protein